MFNRKLFKPVYDYDALRGKIKEVLKTEGKYADEIGRTQNYVSAVFSGDTYFGQRDIERSVEVLGIDVVDIPYFFYRRKVCKSETAH